MAGTSNIGRHLYPEGIITPVLLTHNLNAALPAISLLRKSPGNPVALTPRNMLA